MADLEFTGGLDFTDAAQSLDQFASEAQARLLDALSLDTFSASLSAAAADAFTEPIAITADASAIPDEISAAVAESAIEVPVSADTAPAASEVSDLVATVDGEGATIEVDADTTAAQSSVDDLSSSITDAGDSASGASGHVHEFGLSTGQLAGVAGLAVGEVGGLREASSLLGERTAVATTGALGLAAGVGELYAQGLKAVSAEERFNAVLGETADRVQHVNVGDLNADLFKLTSEMGSTDAATRNAAATIFQFSLNAGASREGAAQFTDELFALASRAVALKPSLGDVSDVATSMEVGLGRARSAAQQFGISISQAEINTRALSDTGKSSASDLTAYEKSVAGAEIAVQRYGDTLKGTITEGSKNAAIEQRRLTAEFEDELAALGKPLVAPALDLIKSAIPVATELGSTLADVASVAIPLVSGALQVLGPLIEPVVIGFLALKAAELAAAGVAALAGGLEVLSGFLPVAGAAVESFAGEVAGASLAIESAAGPIGLLVGVAALAASQLGLFGGAEKSVAEQTHDMAAELAKLSGGQLIRQFEGAAAIRAFGDGISLSAAKLREFRTIAEDNVGTAQRLLDTLRANGENTAGYSRVLNEQVSKQKDAAQAQRDSKDAQDALLGSTDAVTGAAGANASATDVQTQAVKDYIAAVTEQNRQLDEVQNRLLGLPGAQLNQAQAVNDQTKAQNDYNDAVRDHGPASQEAIDAGLRLDGANQQVASSTLALQQAQEDFNNIVGSDSPFAIQQEIDKLKDAQAAHPEAAASLQPYIDQLQVVKDKADALNTNSKVVITADVEQALEAIASVDFALAKTLGGETEDQRRQTLLGIAYAGLAEGGYVEARPGGTPYTIGEGGNDEVVVSPADLPGARANLAKLGVLDQLAAPVVFSQVVYPQSGASASPASSGGGSHTVDNSVHDITIVAPSPEDVPRQIARKQRAMQYLGGR